MSKSRKPNGQAQSRPRGNQNGNQDALRTEARDRVQDMPAETAGGRLDESANEWSDERQQPTMSSQMRDKRGNQPPPKSKR